MPCRRGPTAVVPLESADSDFKYQLAFSRSENPINGGLAQHGGVDHYSKAELQQTDLRGNVAQQLLIYGDHWSEYYGQGE